MVETLSESRDDRGRPGDRDQAFVFGNPRGWLTVMQQARLTIMRGYVMDVRQGARGLAADGDLEWAVLTETGLFVPISAALGN